MSNKRKRRPSSAPRGQVPDWLPAAPAPLPAALGSRTNVSARPAMTERTGPAGPESGTRTGTGTDRPIAVTPPSATVRPLEVTTFACGPVEGVEPQALGVTYWFDAPPDGPIAPLTVRFTGHRLGVQGVAGPADTFRTQTTVDPVLPGSGRIAVTARVLDLEPGEWEVSAAPIPRQEDRPGQRFPTTSGRGTTAFTPAVRARAPGARLAVWPAMVLLGTVLALLTQAALAVGRGVPVLPLLAVTVLACLLGVVGAKIYYLATHRGEPTNLLTVGMSLQGFVLAGVSALTIGSLATGLPGWLALDLTAPGLMFGVTVGRFGCFFGGCCAGRPTASRWGRWSSNRRLGLRRIPVQLMESAAAGVLGSVALLLLTRGDPPTSGVVFVGTIAAYTLVRQLLFPLRELPRKTAHGRALMTIASVAVLLADLVAAVTT